MRGIMESKRQEIRFLNKLLKSQTRPIFPNQRKRKQGSKDDKCDICSHSFINQQGVATHKKRVHGHQGQQKRTVRIAASLKTNHEIKRSDSIKSGGGHSRSNKPYPEKIHMDHNSEIMPVQEK